jgi:hypothetical protein
MIIRKMRKSKVKLLSERPRNKLLSVSKTVQHHFGGPGAMLSVIKRSRGLQLDGVQILVAQLVKKILFSIGLRKHLVSICL